MKFSANWLNEYLGKPLKPEQMVEFLNIHAFEVETCDKFGEDFVLDIKVLPNRAHDCMSHIGIAKELAAISGIEFIPPKMEFSEDKNIKAKDYIFIEVPAKELCPRYSMRVATDIKMGVSPKWMQERLRACGLRPISNIVDITNYVMLETGQPLHAFDVDKVGGKKIIVRRANEGEKITTLEGKSYNLSPQNLVIADEKLAIGIAGIKGGEGPEIDENTKIVAVESANFEPTNIRRTSKAFNLKTDASTRFENVLDPNLTEMALDRCVSLIAEIAEGKVASGLIDVYPDKVKPWKIFADVEWIQGLLGLAVKPQEMEEILTRLGISAKTIKKDDKDFIEAVPPTSRLDLKAQEDLAEEIVRIMGYDKVPPQIPSGILIPAIKDESLVYEDKIKDILAGAGWSEAQNYSFISEEDKKAFKLFKAVEIKNPFSQDQKYLRPTLIVNLVKNIKENFKHFESVRLFEIGHVFSVVTSKPVELPTKIAAVISHKNSKKPLESFFELKGLINVLCEKLGLSDIWFDDVLNPDSPVYWFTFTHPKKRALVKSGEEQFGWIGLIKQTTLADLGIKEEISVFELDLKTLPDLKEEEGLKKKGLVDLATEEREYKPPSKYPAIIRDLAVSVEQTTKTEKVLNIIETAGGQLLQDTDLFDIYEGLAGNYAERGSGPAQLGNKKSLAFRLIYQSDDRNLTDEEVNKLQEKIIKAIEEEGWEVRK